MYTHTHIYLYTHINTHLYLMLLFFDIMKAFFFFTFLPFYVAYGILVPRPGIELVPPAVKVQSLNYWVPGKIPFFLIFLTPGKIHSVSSFIKL